MASRDIEDVVDSNPQPPGVAALRFRAPDGVFRTLIGTLAVVLLVTVTVYHAGHNVPDGLLAGITTPATGWSVLAMISPAFAGLPPAAAADSKVERMGLVFAGGFGVPALGTAAAV